MSNRFFIDHGVIHDRTTGKHVTLSDDGDTDKGLEICCGLMNRFESALERLAHLADNFCVSGVYFNEDKDNLAALNAAFDLLDERAAAVAAPDDK